MASAACKFLFLSGASSFVLSAAAEASAQPPIDADDECAGVDGECGLSALQQKTQKVSAEVEEGAEATSEGGRCANIYAPENAVCRPVVQWVAGGGKWDRHAPEWFHEMHTITGKTWSDGSMDDFQRLYFCSPPGGKACGLPPCSCSKPPCDTCFGGAPQQKPRTGCEGNPDAINCKPPQSPLEYKGQAWPTMTFEGHQEMHIFAVGDWGGMDGTLNPVEGRPRVVAYRQGVRSGPSVFPRTRWDKYHTVRICNHSEFVDCFNTEGELCAKGCGFVQGVDDQPQMLVAEAIKERASQVDPQYILNVGDNFYWGGIEKTCGTPMHELSFTAHHQFNQIFEGVYQGKGLEGKPWLSVLGNHDWGGRVFVNGWDQQIAYTWHSDRWVMPAPYYSQHVEYPDQGFSVDIYMLDSNFMDAKDPLEDPEHNLCGEKHNPVGATCASAGGPASIESCPAFFRNLWLEQQGWLENRLSQSTAAYRIVVTHFPCGHEMLWYRKLHYELKLDLLVTGHRHNQELWVPGEWRNAMGGLTCFVTGGGGGITSEATPNPQDTKDWYGEGQYGFYDLAINKERIFIQSINYDGTVLKTHTINRRF